VSLSTASNSPVEHIYWPKIYPGVYECHVIHYRNHDGVQCASEYLLVMNIQGKCVFQTVGNMRQSKENHCVLKFQFSSDGEFKLLSGENQLTK